MDVPRIIATLLLALGLWIMALMGAGCSNGGPTGHRVTCTDYPVGAPVASRCEGEG